MSDEKRKAIREACFLFIAADDELNTTLRDEETPDDRWANMVMRDRLKVNARAAELRNVLASDYPDAKHERSGK